MNRIAFGIACSIALATVLLMLAISPHIFPHLLLGWIAYLAREMPRVSVRWDGLSIFIAAILVLRIVVHRIARWLRSEMSSGRHVWRWRSTGIVLGIVFVMFISGLAMVGVSHQTYWLLSDDRDFMVHSLPGGARKNEYNLKEMGLALTTSQEVGYRSEERSVQHSWITYSLPFAVYLSKIDRQLPWDHPNNREEAQKLVPSLLNPLLAPAVLRDSDGYGVSHYAGNARVFDENERLLVTESDDGRSNTLLIGEVNSNFQPWAKPDSNRDPLLGINSSADGFGGVTSSRGAYFAMADGSVKFVADDVDPEVLRALSIPSIPNE